MLTLILCFYFIHSFLIKKNYTCVVFQLQTWVFDHIEIKKVFTGHFINHWQPEIADETGNTYVAETKTGSSEIPTANMGFVPKESSTKSVGKWLRWRPTTGNSDMAVKTGSTYMFRTTADSVKISTTHLAVSTAKSLVKVSTSDCSTDTRKLAQDCKISAKSAVVPFLSVGHCRNCLNTLLSSSP